MSEPNDAQAVIAGVLRESLKPLVDPFDTGADSGWVEAWCSTAAEAVDAAFGGLTRQRFMRAVFPDEPTPQSHWVGGWSPEEAQA